MVRKMACVIFLSYIANEKRQRRSKRQRDSLVACKIFHQGVSCLVLSLLQFICCNLYVANILVCFSFCRIFFDVRLCLLFYVGTNIIESTVKF